MGEVGKGVERKNIWKYVLGCKATHMSKIQSYPNEIFL